MKTEGAKREILHQGVMHCQGGGHGSRGDSLRLSDADLAEKEISTPQPNLLLSFYFGQLRRDDRVLIFCERITRLRRWPATGGFWQCMRDLSFADDKGSAGTGPVGIPEPIFRILVSCRPG